ncbi:MAG: hypothetical protein ABWZ52_07195 [Acidimicrobiales bacterium]
MVVVLGAAVVVLGTVVVVLGTVVVVDELASSDRSGKILAPTTIAATASSTSAADSGPRSLLPTGFTMPRTPRRLGARRGVRGA